MVDIGECTSRRFNANGKMLTRQHGKRSNLQIETRAKEIQIAVHTPREEPDMYSESITVGQDTDTYIEVHRREDIALPSPFISDGTMCQENYDYFDCNRKCWNELLKKQCGCTMNRSVMTMESSAICLAACPPQCKVITYDVIVSSRTSNESWRTDGIISWRKYPHHYRAAGIHNIYHVVAYSTSIKKKCRSKLKELTLDHAI
ncbi:Hypothetical predicted protein [Mytilus galloprovincialis]|uniref:Uncharacterized protein n=1 Tax=Mytilus galloprovincialis TaxID=29158 RepID=A0A8B6CHI9_MYTGA|nr:Hypothetical predicted protein [Mytilus galloprovincialis]